MKVKYKVELKQGDELIDMDTLEFDNAEDAVADLHNWVDSMRPDDNYTYILSVKESTLANNE